MPWMMSMQALSDGVSRYFFLAAIPQKICLALWDVSFVGNEALGCPRWLKMGGASSECLPYLHTKT